MRRRPDLRLPKRPKSVADLLREDLRLLPGREVPAFREPVVVNQLGIGFFGPTPRHLIELVRKDAHGYRNGDALRPEEGRRVFLIEATRGNSRVRQPVVGDVVEDVVSGEA